MASTSAPNTRSEESAWATFDSASAPNPLIAVKESECSPRARIQPLGKKLTSPALYSIRVSRSCCGKGNGRSMIESTIEKIAVLAPIPSASVITAVSVNPGDFLSCRNANFRSFSIVPYRLHAVGHIQVVENKWLGRSQAPGGLSTSEIFCSKLNSWREGI